MAAPSPSTPVPLTILMPVYDDWASARLVLEQLDRVLADRPGPISVLLVDDCSEERPSGPLLPPSLVHLTQVEVLRLRRNLGHQRAIAIGLSWLHAERDPEAVVVMDADGEDQPADVPRLLERFAQLGRTRVVFAARMRRSEGWVFRGCYHLYRWLHWLLTGIPVRVGNFSVLARDHLAALTVAPELWNHYAATVLRIRLPHELVRTTRGARLAGRSQLTFTGMVVHGLSAISVFIDVVGVRLSLAMLAGLAALLALLGGIVAVRLATGLALPPGAAYATGLLVILVVQALTVALGLTLLILFQRNSLSFLPIRDYKFFVGEVRALHEPAT
ncbi:glycosyltransferase [bacterium]|nr:glycosyltransferase [bacterium]